MEKVECLPICTDLEYYNSAAAYHSRSVITDNDKQL